MRLAADGVATAEVASPVGDRLESTAKLAKRAIARVSCRACPLFSLRNDHAWQAELTT
jgi:hypothetical protein